MSQTWAEKFYLYSEDAFIGKKLTRFIDGHGYSLIGEYSKRFKKQMGVGNEGRQVPFFKFIVDDAKATKDVRYLPLIINVSITSAVEEDGHVRYMLNDSTLKRLKPIDITSRDDFFVSASNGKVYEHKGNNYVNVSLADIYNRLYKAHTSDMTTFRGISNRLKILILRKFPSLIFAIIALILGWLIWVLKGKRYTYDVIIEAFMDKKEYEKEGIPTKEPSNSIDFFGYKVSVWTLFSYSLMITIVFTFAGESIGKSFPKDSSISGILTIALAVITIIIYDKLLPTAFRNVTKFSANRAYDLKYQGVRLNI